VTDFLETSLSTARFEAYQNLVASIGKGRSAEHLYALNLIYSKELYVVLAGLEVALRNKFHHALSGLYQTNEWYKEPKIFRNTHLEQVQKAGEKLAKIKHTFSSDDLVAELNYGFWVHLLDKPYEQSFWNKSLRHCFPKYGQKPNRPAIEKPLRATLLLRNKIAHLEPIIKYEDTLIQEYRNIVHLLYALCPQTQEWFCRFCKFEEIWNDRYKEL